MTYNAEKILHRYMQGEKFLTLEVWEKILPQNHPYPAPPHTPNCHVNHLGGGEEMDLTHQ